MSIIKKNSTLHIPTALLKDYEIRELKKENSIENEVDNSKYFLYNTYYDADFNEIITLPRESKLPSSIVLNKIIDENIYHPFDFTETRNKMTSVSSLRPYQKEPVELTMNHLSSFKSGILECPAGGGKTNMGIWITQHMNLKTLFICDQYELLEQAYERFEKFGFIKPNVLTSSRIEDNGAGVTLTLFQSLSANEELLNKVKNDYGLVIIDECHISSAPSFNRILLSIQGLKLGLTATDRRKDGLHFIYRKHIGSIITHVEVEMLKCNVEWIVSKVDPSKIKKPFIPDFVKNKAQMYMNLYYAKIFDLVLFDQERNKMIIQKLKEYHEDGRTILVITKTIEHIKLLASLLLDQHIPSQQLHSEQKKIDGEIALQSIKNKSCSILLTVNKANKGMDIDILDTLVLCTGGNNDVYWEQRIGRIQRFKENKKIPLILDISDKLIPEFSNWAKNRSNFYFKQEFQQKILR